jgi:hypothetical protein
VVNYTFSSLKGLLQTAKAMMKLYPDKGALDLLNEPVRPAHSVNPLIQIETHVNVEEGTRV